MILSLLFTVVAFILVIGVLVFIHEGGHFLAAKWVRVWVHEFAIGFGPAVWKRKRGETLYAIRAFPLGGYVRLAGEDMDREEDADVPPDRLFTSKPAWARIFVVLAGPLANLLAALVLMVLYVGIFGAPYVEVGSVVPGAPAEGVLRPGDKILEFDGKAIYFAQQLSPLVQRVGSRPASLVIERAGQRLEVTLTPYWDEEREQYLIGITYQFLLPVVGRLPEGSELTAQGVQEGDRVLRVGDRPVGSWAEVVAALREARTAADPEGPISLWVERDGQLRELRLPAERVALREWDAVVPLALAPLPPTTPVVAAVSPGSRWEEVGLRPGDRLRTAEEQEVSGVLTLVYAILKAQADDGVLTVEFERAGRRLSADLSVAGLELAEALNGLQLQRAKRQPGPLAAVYLGTVQLRSTLIQYYLGIRQILSGQVSATEALRGPVGIANLVGVTLQQGFETFFRFVALLSLVLGITNLIPFPALDGSRVLFIAVNSILKLLTGWSIPPEKEGWIHYIGFLLLLGLIVLITWQDIQRLLRGEL